MCSNVVKFVRRKISEIVLVISGQKKQNFACLSNCRYCAHRAQNLPGACSPQQWGLAQISSKSVHIRRTYRLYSGTHEHRQIAP